MTDNDKQYLKLMGFDSNLARAFVDKWTRERLQELVRELGPVIKILGISPDAVKFRIVEMIEVNMVHLRAELRTKNPKELQEIFGEKV